MSKNLEPGWYSDENDVRRYWTGRQWMTPSDDAADRPQVRRAVWPWIVMAVVGILLLAGVVVGAWWFLGERVDETSALANPSPSATPNPSPSATPTSTALPTISPDPVPADPNVDDSGALSQLSGAMGALFAYIENQTSDDCSYVAHVGNQMAGFTPLDEYRGTYEQITINMQTIGSLCTTNPRDADAVELAVLTRPDVTTILTDRLFLGLEWDGDMPVPGANVSD